MKKILVSIAAVTALIAPLAGPATAAENPCLTILSWQQCL